uniref:Uncharacterized protein n=1 Tax=Caenorhabditis japonica TaxID=281687 RepID=A0A8R1E7E0_CAEJA
MSANTQWVPDLWVPDSLGTMDLWYPKSSRTQRSIGPKYTVPKDTVPKCGTQRVVVPKDSSYPKIPYPKIHRTQRNRTQRVAVPKDPSYPKSLGPKDPGPTEYWPCMSYDIFPLGTSLAGLS